MDDRVSVYQMGSTTANTKIIDGIDGRLFNLWVIGKAQVIVATKTDHLVVINLHLDLLWAFCYPASTITVLFFSLVECFFKFVVKCFQESRV